MSERQMQLVLRSDGTFEKQITLSENIGRQDFLLAELYEAQFRIAPPVKVGKFGNWTIFAARTNEGAVAFAMSRTTLLKQCLIQINANLKPSFVPWRTDPVGYSKAAALHRLRVPVLAHAGTEEADSWFVMKVAAVGKAMAMTVPSLYIYDDGRYCTASLPNVHPGGNLCEGGFRSSLATDVVSRVIAAVREFEDRPGNADLNDSSDVTKPVWELKNGTMTVTLPKNTPSASINTHDAADFCACMALAVKAMV